MKKLLCFLLASALILTSAMALAETKLNPTENRGITLQSVSDNEMIEGVSPTTGRTLSEIEIPEGFTGMAKTGKYVPMIAQIGNDSGGIGNRSSWGIAYVDVLYEIMLYRTNGANTRLIAVFNDQIPDSLGPIRSMRVTSVWLREEWDAAYMYHGQQTYEGSNAVEEMRKLGHDYIFDPLMFNGWAGGKAWNKYYSRRSNIVAPYNQNVNAVGIYSLIPEDYNFPNHTFKFTDEVPEGDPATDVKVIWRSDANNEYNSELVYDAASNAYLRYILHGKDGQVPYVDRDSGEQLAFANVIVQFTDSAFNGRRDAPIQRVIGEKYSAVEGNADFFMAGKHVSGYWKHDSVTERTVFYGPDGNEISLQRGKTIIIVFPRDEMLLADDSAPQGSSIIYE